MRHYVRFWQIGSHLHSQIVSKDCEGSRSQVKMVTSIYSVVETSLESNTACIRMSVNLHASSTVQKYLFIKMTKFSFRMSFKIPHLLQTLLLLT